jgi:hypothetical protein
VALAQAARHLDPVLAAEVDVEQHERDILLLGYAGELARVRRLGDAIALELEVHAAEQANRVVVVRDDDETVDLGVHPGLSLTAYDGRRMERTVRRNEPHGYAEAVSHLWERVGGALVRLERVAESPAEAATDDFLGELPQLQYGLHAAAELAVGIDAPRGAELLHEELVAALAEARDVTAEVGHVLEEGDAELVEPLLPEWRGVLFRVRLARLRAIERTAVPIGSDGDAERRRRHFHDLPSVSALVATGLVIAGAFLFTAGAVLAAWPVWAAGLALLAGGFVLYRPY